MYISIINALIGLGLTLAPEYLGYDFTDAAYFDRVAGPVLIALGTVLLWELMTPLRWATALVGLTLLFSPLFLEASDSSIFVFHLITGLLVLGVSLGGRRRRHRYGGGWRSLLKRETEEIQRITWG